MYKGKVQNRYFDAMHLVKIQKFSLIPLFIILSIGVVDVATDIYIPTLPGLVQYFTTSEENVALTISAYLFAVCLSSPIYGPLSDALGRRIMLLVGLCIFTFFSFLCAWSWDVKVLILFRFLQGIGGGVAWVLGLAIVKDIYKKEESVKVMATIGVVIALAPAAAPILGGYMGVYFGWQSNFYLLGGISLLVGVFLFKSLPETLPFDKRQPFSIHDMLENYAILLVNKPFLGYCLISALTFAGMWAYISTMPFFFIKELNMSMGTYGYYQMALLVFYMLGTFLNRYLVRRLGINPLLGWGLGITLLGAVFLSIAALLTPASPVALTGMMAIYCLGMGIVFSNTSTQALEIFPEIGGASSALLGAFEMALAALAVVIAGEIYTTTVLPLSLFIFMLALVSGIIFLGLTQYSTSWVSETFSSIKKRRRR